MQEDPRKKMKAQFLLAIAQGEPVAEWSRQNQVPRRTVQWASNPKIRRVVDAFRRRALDQAIGRLSSLAIKAADGIARLAEGADSEPVQLRAWHAVLADQMAVSKFSDLGHRTVEIEEQLRDRTEQANFAG